MNQQRSHFLTNQINFLIQLPLIVYIYRVKTTPKINQTDYSIFLDEESKKALNQKILFLFETRPHFFSEKRQIDHFGQFEQQTSNIQRPQLFPPIIPAQRKSLEQEMALEAEWEKLLYSKTVVRKMTQQLRQEVKHLVRKGIPNKYRSLVWQILTNSFDLHLHNEKANTLTTSSYCRFLKSTLDEPTVTQILKDIDRTSPTLKFFRSENHLRQLFRILKAYSVHAKEHEYTQGMAFPAALFLYYMPEDQAYWAYYQLMQKYGGIFMNGFKRSFQMYEVALKLLEKYNKSFVAHIDEMDMRLDLQQVFCGKFLWGFMVKDFAFNLSVRLFDQLLCEGEKTIYRGFMAYCKWCQKGAYFKLSSRPSQQNPQYEQEFSRLQLGQNGVNIECLPYGETMERMQKQDERILNDEEFVQIMLSYTFSTKEMEKFKTDVLAAETQ